jgi:hypothetical protein
MVLWMIIEIEMKIEMVAAVVTDRYLLEIAVNDETEVRCMSCCRIIAFNIVLYSYKANYQMKK